jgi:hypothetical protein
MKALAWLRRPPAEIEWTPTLAGGTRRTTL